MAKKKLNKGKKEFFRRAYIDFSIGLVGAVSYSIIEKHQDFVNSFGIFGLFIPLALVVLLFFLATCLVWIFTKPKQ